MRTSFYSPHQSYCFHRNYGERTLKLGHSKLLHLCMIKKIWYHWPSNPYLSITIMSNHLNCLLNTAISDHRDVLADNKSILCLLISDNC